MSKGRSMYNSRQLHTIFQITTDAANRIHVTHIDQILKIKII